MSADLIRFATVAGGVIGTWRRGALAKVLIRVVWPELAHGLDEMVRSSPKPRPPAGPSGVSPSADGRR